MNYNETIEFMYSKLPMFQRIGAAAYKANLDNTVKICEIFGNPQQKFPAIHIAGTNGKGSVSNMVSSILQEAGFKTGLFTSPHLIDFRERIRVDGKMISNDSVVNFVEKCINKQVFEEEFNPSFFELTFAMAMDYFADNEIDVAVVEVGMGGRLDSTNIVNSVLSVITNIGLDHTTFLGDTLEKIATEKAGIIKNGIPVIIGRKQAETETVFRKTAMQCKSRILFAEEDANITFLDFETSGKFIIQNSDSSFLEGLSPLKGIYQKENIQTVISISKLLRGMEDYNCISDNDILNGISNVVKNTGFQGRWQIIGENPIIICDTGHNLDGISMVVDQIKGLEYNHLHIVFGAVNDKEIEGILKLLPINADYYFCRPDIPRGLDAAELYRKASGLGLSGNYYDSVRQALDAAKSNAIQSDFIFVGGSTFVVAEVI